MDIVTFVILKAITVAFFHLSITTSHTNIVFSEVPPIVGVLTKLTLIRQENSGKDVKLIAALKVPEFIKINIYQVSISSKL